MSAKISDTGTASHKPLIPKIIGNTIMVPTKKMKVLEKDMIADIFPLDRAVNSILEKVLKPTNSNARENNRLPVIATA